MHPDHGTDQLRVLQVSPSHEVVAAGTSGALIPHGWRTCLVLRVLNFQDKVESCPPMGNGRQEEEADVYYENSARPGFCLPQEIPQVVCGALQALAPLLWQWTQLPWSVVSSFLRVLQTPSITFLMTEKGPVLISTSKKGPRHNPQLSVKAHIQVSVPGG